MSGPSSATNGAASLPRPVLGPAPAPACHWAAIFPEGLGQWRVGLGPAEEGRHRAGARRGPALGRTEREEGQGRGGAGRADRTVAWAAQVRLDLGEPAGRGRSRLTRPWLERTGAE